MGESKSVTPRGRIEGNDKIRPLRTEIEAAEWGEKSKNGKLLRDLSGGLDSLRLTLTGLLQQRVHLLEAGAQRRAELAQMRALANSPPVSSPRRRGRQEHARSSAVIMNSSTLCAPSPMVGASSPASAPWISPSTMMLICLPTCDSTPTSAQASSRALSQRAAVATWS